MVNFNNTHWFGGLLLLPKKKEKNIYWCAERIYSLNIILKIKKKKKRERFVEVGAKVVFVPLLA